MSHTPIDLCGVRDDAKDAKDGAAWKKKNKARAARDDDDDARTLEGSL